MDMEFKANFKINRKGTMVHLNEFKYTRVSSVFILKLVSTLNLINRNRKIKMNNYTILVHTIIIQVSLCFCYSLGIH